MKWIAVLIILLTVMACGLINPSREGSVPPIDYDICLKKMCIEGHVYYLACGGYAGGIAPKLTDDGKPVHCEGSKQVPFAE